MILYQENSPPFHLVLLNFTYNKDKTQIITNLVEKLRLINMGIDYNRIETVTILIKRINHNVSNFG